MFIFFFIVSAVLYFYLTSQHFLADKKESHAWRIIFIKVFVFGCGGRNNNSHYVLIQAFVFCLETL